MPHRPRLRPRFPPPGLLSPTSLPLLPNLALPQAPAGGHPRMDQVEDVVHQPHPLPGRPPRLQTSAATAVPAHASHAPSASSPSAPPSPCPVTGPRSFRSRWSKRRGRMATFDSSSSTTNLPPSPSPPLPPSPLPPSPPPPLRVGTMPLRRRRNVATIAYPYSNYSVCGLESLRWRALVRGNCRHRFDALGLIVTLMPGSMPMWIDDGHDMLPENHVMELELVEFMGSVMLIILLSVTACRLSDELGLMVQAGA